MTEIMKPSIRFLFILLAVLGGVVSLQAADWPTFRGNMGRTGYYPDPVGCPSGAPAWKISLGCEIVSSPVVQEGVLYIGARDSCVYAIDCGSGIVRWKFKTGGWVDATPLVFGDRLIVGSRDSTVYVLDKNTGIALGRMIAGTQLSSPLVTAGGTVLTGVGLPKGGMAAYQVDGFQPQRTASQWSVSLPQYTYSSPAIRGQAVVIGATDGKLYGIDAGAKDTIWSLQTGGVIYLSTPAIDNVTVYFAPGDEDRNVYAVNLLTGAVLWKSSSLSPLDNAGGALTKKTSGHVLCSADLERLLRLDPASRKATILRLKGQGVSLPRVREWNAPGTGLAKGAAGSAGDFIPLGGMKTSSVAVSPNNVYVVQKDLGYVLTNDSLVEYKQQFTLQMLNKSDGVPKWSFSERRTSPQLGYCSSPVATKNLVFFGWGEGRVFGLDAGSGKNLWQDSLQGHIISSPAIADGNLYVATMAGNLYKYTLTATPPGLDFQQSTYCYPNPARGSVSGLQVFVDRSAQMSMVVYTMADKPVFRIETGLTAGKRLFDWDLRHVANGVYFARIRVKYADGSEEKKTVKIAVLK